MARIGDYIQAGLNTYDPSPYLQAQGNATASIGSSIAGGIGAVGDVIEDRKQKKDKVKTGIKIADAMATLYPNLAQPLAPIIEGMKDDELRLSEQAALADQLDMLINAGMQQSRDEAQLALANRGMAIQEGQFAIEKSEAETRSRMLADELDKKDQSDKILSQNQEFLARPMLEQALAQTIAVERAGGNPLVDSDRLKTAFLFKEPERQIQAAMAAIQGLPKSAQEQINFNTPVTIDGQPGTAATAYDPSTGRMRIVPIDEPISQGSDGVFSVTTTNYSQGAAAGGPDEMQDKWTNRGYSSTGKNLTKGVVAVNDSVFPLGTVFRDSNSGEVFIAADRHGNKDASVVDFYQPPGEYKATKGKRTLEVIGNVKPATTPEGIQAQIAQFQGKGGRVTAGAVKQAAPLTPTQAKIEEAKLAEIEQNLTKQTDMKRSALAGAEETLKLIDELPSHPGFQEAVGAGFYNAVGGIPGIPDDWTPAGTDKAGAVSKIEKLQAGAFLTAIQQLRGLGALSDAEGKKLEAAAANLNRKQSEEDFKKSLLDYRRQVERVVQEIKSGTGAPTPAAPATSASDRLKAAKAALGQ